MKQSITKAVFPAAGFGTRFLPITKSQPKEMLPIVDKPVIQYLVEEAVASGIKDIIIVTGRGKRAIEDHFDYSPELENNLVEKGKHSLLKEVRQIPRLANFIYARQPYPLGDGHAVLCAEGSLNGEPFAIMFGDDIIDSDIPALKQLIQAYEKTKSPIIGLQRVPKSEVSSYGIIEPINSNGRLHQIKSLIEKPSPNKAPSNLGIIGKYIVTPDIIPALKKAKPSHGGEIRLIDGFRELIKTRPIYGYEIEGTRYDTGDKIGLLKATIDFALKRPDTGPEIRKHFAKMCKIKFK
ncbi:UTP--glucose-1-phosphate uridylyltransferase GalU [Candidatus Peregrinibacteria bacterium]|nr:UTP--glucose-1-phosphate uridylyltransferase GalU [Candidatus Peregrinibacteria bacterium]